MAIMANDSSTKTNGATHEFKDKVMGAGDHLEKLSQNAGERVGAMASDVAGSASEYLRTGRAYVRENPAKGLALAAAAGVVAGSIITMFMQRRP